MIQLGLLFVLMGTLVACSPAVDAAGEQVVASASPAETPEPAVDVGGGSAEEPVVDQQPGSLESAPVLTSQPLDLSLPDLSEAELTSIPGDFKPKKLDTQSLFNKEKQDQVSFSVRPNLVLGEKLLSLPELDGGSVSVEVKTK